MANPFLSMDVVQLVGRIRQNSKQIEDLANLTNMLAEAVQIRFTLDNTVNIPGIKPEVRELLKSILNAPDTAAFTGAFAQTTQPSHLALEQGEGYGPRGVGRPRKYATKKVATKRVVQRRLPDLLASDSEQPVLPPTPLNATEPVGAATQVRESHVLAGPEGGTPESTTRTYGPTQHSNSPLYRLPSDGKTPIGFHARALVQFAKEHGNRLDTGNFRAALKGRPGFTTFLDTTIYTMLGRLQDRGTFKMISEKPRVYELLSDDLSFLVGPPNARR